MINLASPYQGDKLTLSNRLVMPPMASNKADAQGRVTDGLLAWYDAKTKDGAVGLVIVEHCFVHPVGRAKANQLSAAVMEDVAGLQRLAEVIHQNGAKCVLQINHAGSRAAVPEPVAPSAMPAADDRPAAKALNVKELQDTITAFQGAAWRAKKAGFDGVEIHSAHGFLLNQFYSPLTNRRDDEYGGDLAGRVHMHLRIIDAVKNAAGKQFPILLRLGVDDFQPGGSTMADALAAAQAFAAAGVVMLDISGGINGFLPAEKAQLPPGWFQDCSRAIRQAGMPTILTGGITTRAQADQLLADGACDLIGVGRPIYKDDHYARQLLG